MDPVTLTIGSAIFSAVGAVSQANAASASMKSQARAADYNAAIQKQQAAITRQQGGAAEETHRRRVRSILGMQRAAQAESGLGFTGTGADLLSESAANAELDALTMRYETDLRARGLLAESALSTFEGSAARAGASSARTSGYLSAGAALATGAAQYGAPKTSKPIVPAGTTPAGNSFARMNSLRYRY